jgi:hypothetical protein
LREPGAVESFLTAKERQDFAKAAKKWRFQIPFFASFAAFFANFAVKDFRRGDK